ncbi:MAG: hypothetical protein H7061_07040 [Bdellovibrionaceae bacterium]|nr:hypothetical protein [Bdellovibrio sp.]
MSLSLELVGLKSGEPIQFALMQHWISLQGRVSIELWQQAFQEQWQKGIEASDLLIPGIEKYYPERNKPSVKPTKNTESAVELIISFNHEEKVWALSDVEFMKALNPVTFQNHRQRKSAKFFDNKDGFLASSSGHSNSGTFVALHRPTGTHKIINFKSFKVAVA